MPAEYLIPPGAGQEAAGPASGFAQGVYILDPATGLPSAAGTPTGGPAPTTTRIGLSSKGTVGTTSATIVTAGTHKGQIIVQNVDAANTLFLSFVSPATPDDIQLAPGASLSLDFAPSNNLFGIGSAAGVKWAVIGG